MVSTPMPMKVNISGAYHGGEGFPAADLAFEPGQLREQHGGLKLGQAQVAAKDFMVVPGRTPGAAAMAETAA